MRLQGGQTLVLEVGVASDQGTSRESNEDAVHFAQSDPSRVSFIVADGMGGYGGGAEAAEIAAHTTLEQLGDSVHEARSAAELLENALFAANEAVLDAQTRGSAVDMGCTVLAGFAEGKALVLGHLGDVRALLFRGNEPTVLTLDHNPWNDQQRMSGIPASPQPADPAGIEASLPPTRALGRAMMRPEITKGELLDGDVLVVCTDGIWRVLSSEQMSLIASKTPLDAWSIARRLVDAARNQNRGEDNATALGIRCKQGAITEPRTQRKTTPLYLLACAAIFLLGFLLRDPLESPWSRGRPGREDESGAASRTAQRDRPSSAASSASIVAPGGLPSHEELVHPIQLTEVPQAAAVTASKPPSSDEVASRANPIRDVSAASEATMSTDAPVERRPGDRASVTGDQGLQRIRLRLVPTDAIVHFEGVRGDFHHGDSVTLPIGGVLVRAEAPESRPVKVASRVAKTHNVLEVTLCKSAPPTDDRGSGECIATVRFVVQ